MPKTRQQKQEVLDKLTQELQDAKSATLATFTAITVKIDQELRRSLKQENISYGVVKKTLLRKVFEKLGYEQNNLDSLTGNITLAVSNEDEVAPAKLISQFAKDNEGVTVQGGILENKWVDAIKINALAKLPSKQELIAKTVGTIKAPLNGFVNVLAGNTRNLINVLNAIKEQK